MDFRERKTENGKLKDESLCKRAKASLLELLQRAQPRFKPTQWG